LLANFVESRFVADGADEQPVKISAEATINVITFFIVIP
jgi:hypothetical protein